MQHFNKSWIFISNLFPDIYLLFTAISYLNLTCSAVLKLACYANYILKVIFYFLKLSKHSQIINFFYLPNFCLNLTCSEVLKLVYYVDYISKDIFLLSKLSQILNLITYLAQLLSKFYMFCSYDTSMLCRSHMKSFF